MNSIKLCAAIGIAGLLSACAQQEEPAIITPEPFYDKYGSDGSGIGGGGCVDGYVYVPGTVPQEDLCIPEDDCEPAVVASTGQVIPCPPPRRTPDPQREGSPSDSTTPGTPQRNPQTNPTTGARN